MKTKVKRTPLYVDPNLDGGESLRKYIKKVEREISSTEDQMDYENQIIEDAEETLRDLRVELTELMVLRQDLRDELDNCKDCADGL